MPRTTERSLRTCKLIHDDENDCDLLVITQGEGEKKRQDFYRVERNTNAPRCFRLHKLVHADEEATTYDVNVPEGTCDCTGFLQWNRCKHITALKALIEARRLS